MPRPSERTLNVLLCPRAGIERGRIDPTHLSTPAAFFTGQSLQERSLSQLLCNLIRSVVVNPAVELISLSSMDPRGCSWLKFCLLQPGGSGQKFSTAQHTFLERF
ncbi:hypothetical protein Q7C36_020577 [Tachysurus vachellii]|uniref:Uncharacterized protein n=1 Tax=Tachysurus vachellii TaxID=175792 RepID=A0AA88IW34_TACVA|nr:hypothetical protein Q7C36_020577 [Tachysurus vachellii]